MAGTASAGVEAGQMGLFRGRPWIATPDRSTDSTALKLVRQVAEELGSQWFAASAEQQISRRIDLAHAGAGQCCSVADGRG